MSERDKAGMIEADGRVLPLSDYSHFAKLLDINYNLPDFSGLILRGPDERQNQKLHENNSQ